MFCLQPRKLGLVPGRSTLVTPDVAYAILLQVASYLAPGAGAERWRRRLSFSSLGASPGYKSGAVYRTQAGVVVVRMSTLELEYHAAPCSLVAPRATLPPVVDVQGK
ncbi:hypothetical protein F5Y07DRAFT_393333 [Xylaria sp. FL0933]|nr:hypothetical protein F5Y07DRAFT_393333 [Xylaria sp. FL0933]